MGAPVPEMAPADDSSAEALLGSLKTIAAAERRRHASIFNYWLSIRGKREFPPIRDLDPLEISDAGPCSLLLEMVGGGEDAVIRHLGHSIKGGLEVERIGEAPNPSLLSCIAGKLPIVAACRQAYAFEEEFESENGTTRCWVTLLPFTATGTWVDYVYGFVSLDPADGSADAVADCEPEAAEQPTDPFAVPLGPLDAASDEAIGAAPATPEPEPDVEPEPAPDADPEPEAELDPDLEPEAELDPEPEVAEIVEPDAGPEAEDEPEPAPAGTAASLKAGFSSKLFDRLASSGGFYGTILGVEPDLATPAAEAGPEQASCETEGPLQSKLSQVRAKTDEARQAKLRANAALYAGLSAAYDFALDAEDQPEEYLRLVEAQGLKIQLRSPMTPVVRLAFGGMCDDATIAQLESVLAWALKQDLPRGSLAERIEAEGGLAPILNGKAAA